MAFDNPGLLRQNNIILDTDSYKLSHYLGYPEDLERVYSYFESRGGRYPDVSFFGVQPWIIELANTPVEDWMLEEAVPFCEAHGFEINVKGWEDILADYGGFLPVEIKTVDEGSVVPVRVPLVTIENMDDRLPWLTSYLETPFLRPGWYGPTTATRLTTMKRKLKPFFDETVGNSDFATMAFAILNFASRGTTGKDADQVSGASHLAHFMGSDSVNGVRFTKHYYGCEMPGFSVPATEHSLMCSHGSDGVDVLRYLLRKMGRRGGILSIVGDTWDIFENVKAAASIADEFKAAGVKYVARPDSGEIDEVLPEVFKTLVNGFGTKNLGNGYYDIDGAAGLWGDGMNEDTVIQPFQVAKDLKIAATSAMAGMGGGMAQGGIDRDTLKSAFKASAVRQGGHWRGIAKDPSTDQGKRSKKGRLGVFIDPTTGGFRTVINDGDSGIHEKEGNLLTRRYYNGELTALQRLDDIRVALHNAL